MRKKLILFLVAALATCGTAGVLSACNNEPAPGAQEYNPGDTIVEEREGEFTYDEYGNLIGQKYTGTKITVKYLVSESAYITLSGEKASEMVVDGYSGDLKELSVSDIEDNIVIGNVKVSVKGIADGAFYGCETLETVDLTKTNSSLSFKVGNSAFANCVALTSVKMPEEKVYTVSAEIGSRAFANNTALSTLQLGNKLVGIGSSAFQNCIALTSVTIPENVTVINSRTFADCDALTSINVSGNAKLKSIQDGAFTNTGINSLNLSNLSELRYIGSNAFSATKLSSVNLPDSVSYVGYSAFYNCKNLSTVNIPFLGNSISKSSAFTSIYGVDGNDTRNLNVTVKAAASVPDYSFENMENITSLTISSFAKVGAYKIYEEDGVSFSRVNLTEEESYGDNVQIDKVIGERAFSGCKKLSNIVLPADTEGLGDYAFSGCTVLGNFTIPASAKTIGAGAFYNCKAFNSMTIPASVTSVGNNAFGGCSNLDTLTVGRLNGVEIDKDTKLYEYVSLGNVASWFNSNNSINSITVSSLYTLPESTFSGMNTLTSINLTFKDINEALFEDEGNVKYIPDGLPSSVKLGNYAFRNCVMLNSLTITDEDGIIESIGDNTFENCRNLPSFTVPATVTQIGSSAFKGCEAFSSFTVPASVTSVGSNAFGSCTALTSLTIEGYNGVKTNDNVMGNIPGMGGADTYYTIGDLSNLFNGSSNIPSNLTTLTLKNVNYLADNALNGWSNLVTLNIEFTATIYTGSGKDAAPHYTTIGDYALNGCKNLAILNITGGDNVKVIGKNAFANCELLTSATLAKFGKVAKIDDRAFSGCKGLNTVTLSGTLTDIGNQVFYNCPNVSVLNIGNYAALTNSISSLFGASNDYVTEENNSYNTVRVQKYIYGVPATLETVTLNGIETLSDLKTYTFDGLSMVKVISLNLSTDKTSLLIEDSNPFAGCTSLLKVFIPETITEIYFNNGVSVWGNGEYELGAATVYTYTGNLSSYGNYWYLNGNDKIKYTATDYTGKSYTLNLNGGVLPEGFIEDAGDEKVVESCPIVVEEGPLTADKLPTLTKEEHVFIGWFSNSYFEGKPVSFPYYSSNTNPQLYAKWVEADKFVETANQNFTVSGNTINSSDTTGRSATYTIKVWKPSTVTLTAALRGDTYRNGTLTISIRKADGSEKTVFTINNYSSGNEQLGISEYRYTLESKQLSVNLEIGDSLVIVNDKYSTYDSYNYARVTYSVADKQDVTVTAPVIPETTLPTYNPSDIVDEKGVEVDEETFAQVIENFRNLGYNDNFTCSMTINGVTVTETYDIDNNVLKQELVHGGTTQTYYYVYDNNYWFNDGYNGYVWGATKLYFKLTDAQFAEMEELAKQEPGAEQKLEMIRGKWIFYATTHENLIRVMMQQLHFENPSITNDIEDYDFDTESGAYSKVIVNGGDSGLKSVMTITVDENGKANIYLSLYYYNELYYTVKTNGINDSTLTLPADFSNAVDLMNMMDGNN